MSKKEHEVRSFDDLCNLVDNKNFEKLAEDVKVWLISYHLMLQKLRDKYPKKTNGKLNTEIAKGCFYWIDDGKNDIKGVEFEYGYEKIKIYF